MGTKRLEASVVHSICTQLENLGWVVDESSPKNNVTQQRVKTEAQKASLKKETGKLRFPDFVLYERGTTRPIGIIEAKKPGKSLNGVLQEAEEKYAKPLKAPLVFAYNDTFVDTKHLDQDRKLKIDGEDVRQFVDHYTSLRFINEGPEILSAPEHLQISRDELIRVFKRQANYLREAGITAGLERFGVFSDILFLKLMDELCQLREHSEGADVPLAQHLRWSYFQDKKPSDRLTYVSDVIWPEMNKKYGDIFSDSFPIASPEIFNDIVEDLSRLNFTGTDVDIKGDAFEYFLKNAYQGVKIKDLGEYFTPRNIVRTMVSMVNPKFGEKVYDPFCGTGGFLIEAFRYISLRVKVNEDRAEQLKCETIYGTEIAATARVARMNMILFGDGHSNVEKNDSFANPVKEKYDVVLTNPPYSQKTRYGDYYPIPSSNGDAIAVQHCIQSLKPGGRAAILLKEDFLTKGGDIGEAREYLFRSAKDLTIISLPRRLFEPYTPTKTSIIYFEKNGTGEKTSFFVVQNVGHTFGARKRSISDNDLPQVLNSIRYPDEKASIEHYKVKNTEIKKSEGSLWIYDYQEVLPATDNALEYLGDYIQKSGERLSPGDFPGESFRILGVSNRNGVFFNEEKIGSEIAQKYIRVKAGDLVYNPHRVNVGSLGLVLEEHEGGIISGIYVVFRPKETSLITSSYLFYLLKSETYLKIIRSYDTKHGAVRANLNWEQLQRIKVVVPNKENIKNFTKQYEKIKRAKDQIVIMESRLPLAN